MSTYSDIITVMKSTTNPSKAIKAKYLLAKPTEERRLLPVLLGPEPDDSNDPVVLCYQYAGPGTDTSSPPSKKNWRCFKVKSLNVLEIVDFQTLPPFNSPKFTHKRVERQSCVDNDDIELWRKDPYVQPTA